MNEGSPYGWLVFAALGLGLFLSSLVRKDRSRLWLMAGFSLFILALGGAFIFTDFIVPGFVVDRLLPFYIPLTLFFFAASWRLAVLGPFLIFLGSLIPIIWGSSGNYAVEKGIYPVKITCFPATADGRSYNVVYADGRESTVSGCGDYLVIERVNWDWRLFFMTQREYPLGFSEPPRNDDSLVMELQPVPLTLDQPKISDRPGMWLSSTMIGPIREEPFYTWWLVRDGHGELVLTSLNPGVLE
ncbi:MAG: hypothetical protein PQJ59_15520 [Spirochaetales bacterium]|nr:hypothetical protein [Spirochaetales bacterium]